MRFEKHIFICANQKAEGKACCGQEQGFKLIETFRELLREHGIQGKVRAQRAGCLDACTKGPAMVVYPEGIYYGNVKPEDAKRIVEEHIIGGKPVEELVLEF
jgi:(2Fe-2S) ferredoxin